MTSQQIGDALVKQGMIPVRIDEDTTEFRAPNQHYLIEAGAVHGSFKDRHGDRHYGWWLDGVFLGRDDRTAAEAI